jgi:hypothetical protein
MEEIKSKETPFIDYCSTETEINHNESKFIYVNDVENTLDVQVFKVGSKNCGTNPKLEINSLADLLSKPQSNLGIGNSEKRNPRVKNTKPR